MKVDLNCDLGESFGAYKIGEDDRILDYVSSVNIACGYHAGDPMVMAQTVKMALEKEIAIGAHPGFPDLMGFRRNMQVTHEEARNYMIYQMGALDGFIRAAGGRMNHVKPHGALYNMAAVDYELALALAQAVYDYDKDLIFVALAGSQAVKAGKDVGLRVAGEVFADRAYEEDGTLVSRSKEGAVIHDENLALARSLDFVEKKKVLTITGKEIDIEADTICLHGDNEGAVLFARTINEKFKEKGIRIAAAGQE